MSARLSRFLVLLVALAALLLAGCGSDSEPAGPSPVKPADAPELGELLSSSLKALNETPDESVAYAMDLEFQATPSESAAPELGALLTEPFALRAEGGFSNTTATARGSVEFNGQTYEAQAMADETRTFVNLMGEWYGDENAGFGDVSEDTTDPAELRQALADIQQYAGDVMEADVTEGPEMDGVATWQAQGKCNADGIAEVAQAEGEPFDDSDREAAELLCDVSEVTVVVGAEDRLPRQFKVELDFDSDTLAKLADASAEPELSQLESMSALFDLKLSDYGQDIAFPAPDEFKPLDEVIPVLYQVLMASGPAMGGSPEVSTVAP